MASLHEMRARSCTSHSLMPRALTFLSSFFFFLTSRALVSPGSSNDELALLSFKSMLSEGSLASWNTSSHHCGWPGVVCGGRRHPTRVAALRMDGFDLSGRISPFLGNLSFLEELNLSDNHLAGEIPPELGRLANLRVLNLSVNQLQGEVPTEIGASLKNLVSLDLSQNFLSGQIPPSLAELPVMEFLSLLRNNLSGEIPPALGNLSNLRFLALSKNTLSGAIPPSFGMLNRLSGLYITFDNLSGVLPTSIWNISSLEIISVQHNMLRGTIPPNAFSNLPRLLGIYMDNNQFHGHIPDSIVNASNLRTIQINANFFSGTVPTEVGRLTNLSFLQISRNLLQAKEPRDLEFISAITNCSRLRILALSDNKFEGVLPDSLSNLSTSLTHLILSDNRMSGSIPKDIGNLMNLRVIEFSRCSFTGTLPSSLSRLKHLVAFFVSENKISGSIPWTIGNLTELNSLYLGKNAFSGRLPSTLGNLTKLLALDLSSNNFIGPIPVGLFNIPTLSEIFDLSHNNLEGSITQEIRNLKNLVAFHAESNKLSGEIPATLGECQLLQHLYLQNNFLTGRIPSLLSQLKGLETLDLSNNNLSGQIPNFFGNISMLYYLNLSFNNFVGEVPNFGVFAIAIAISIQGNGKLCGGISDLHLPPCPFQSPKKRHKFLVMLVATSLVATLAILVLLCNLLTRHKKSIERSPSTTSIQGYPMISYLQLVKATDGFSTDNLLGSGSFGSVYRGELDGHAGEGTNLVAVKVFKIQTPKAHESFTAECEVLRNMRHRNLVKIITVCSSIDTRGNDFKAIVYGFLPNGTLEGWLHPDKNDQVKHKHLNLHQRVVILLDVVYALEYLHCHGPAPVAHCDVKSSNVLLDAGMVAHVGDFGLARVLVEGSSFPQQSTSSMGFRGTIGYAAPEYGVGNIASTKGDIYSYGILVLETVTGKRPTDSRFRQGLCLCEYVELGLAGRVADVADLSLNLQNGLQAANDSSNIRKIDCVASLLRLGISCSRESPSDRTPTGDIIKELREIKESLEGIQSVEDI